MKGLEHLNLLKRRFNNVDEFEGCDSFLGRCSHCQDNAYSDMECADMRASDCLVAKSKEAAENKGVDNRTCTCHPDDKPPKPCPRQFALTECRAEHNRRIISKIMKILKDYHNSTHWDEDAFRALREIEGALDEI